MIDIHMKFFEQPINIFMSKVKTALGPDSPHSHSKGGFASQDLVHGIFFMNLVHGYCFIKISRKNKYFS
jgi:hypothetical protein